MRLYTIEIFGSVYSTEFVVMSVSETNNTILDNIDKSQLDVIGFITYRPLEKNQLYVVFKVDMDYKKTWDLEYSHTKGEESYSGIYIKLYDIILPYLRSSVIKDIL